MRVKGRQRGKVPFFKGYVKEHNTNRVFSSVCQYAKSHTVYATLSNALCGQNRLKRFHALISAFSAPFYTANQEKKTDHDLPWALLRPENWAYFIKATYRRSQF